MRDQRLWTWHVLAGLVILVFLGLHMAIMHLDVLLGIFNPADPHPIAWANVVGDLDFGFRWAHSFTEASGSAQIGFM